MLLQNNHLSTWRLKTNIFVIHYPQYPDISRKKLFTYFGAVVQFEGYDGGATRVWTA
jgi:hypothetical protein